MDGPDRRSARAAGLRRQRLRDVARRLQGVSGRAPGGRAAARAGRRSRAPATAVLAGRARRRAGCRSTLPALARLLHLSAGVVRVAERDGPADAAVSRRGLGRRPLPARALPLRPRRRRPPGRRALVRPGRPRAAAGRAARGRRGDDAGRHRRAVAHRLALRRARLPPHLLGRRHDARAGARARGLGRARAAAADALPRRRAVARLVGADGVHEFPVALVGARRRRARDRAAGEARSRRGRRGAARVPARHARPARRRRRRARRPVARGARRSTASRRVRRPRRRDPAARLDAPDGPGRDRVARDVRLLARGRAAGHRRRRTSSPSTASTGSTRGSTAGPTSTGRCAASRCARSCCGSAGTRTWAATPPSSSSAPPTSTSSTTAATARPSSRAGLVEGRLHLAAYALGIGASGMTFLDSEIAGLLGEPLAGLLFTCVGVPTLSQQGRRPAGRAGVGRRAHGGADLAGGEPRGSELGITRPSATLSTSMSTAFQVKGRNAKALFTLKLHRGDGMALLAMNWKAGTPPNDFVGFAIEYNEPGREKFFALNNRLSFPRADGTVSTTPASTVVSPIQKFRWVHFPAQCRARRRLHLPGDAGLHERRRRAELRRVAGGRDRAAARDLSRQAQRHLHPRLRVVAGVRGSLRIRRQDLHAAPGRRRRRTALQPQRIPRPRTRSAGWASRPGTRSSKCSTRRSRTRRRRSASSPTT